MDKPDVSELVPETICPGCTSRPEEVKEELFSMQDRLLKSKTELLKLKSDHHECQTHVRQLIRQVAFLDELNDAPVYCGLRELEGQILKVIQIVEDVKTDFAAMKYVPDPVVHQRFLVALTKISDGLEDCEPSLFLTNIFTDMTLEDTSEMSSSGTFYHLHFSIS